MSNAFSSNPQVDRYQKTGQDVPIDYFLYACYEAEQTSKALEKKNQSKAIQWPTLQDFTGEDLAEEINSQKLEDLLADLMSWYAANFPDLATGEAWDFQKLPMVAPALVSMTADVVYVYEEKTSSKLETFQPNAPTKDWALLTSLVERFFSRKQHLISKYLEWMFGENKNHREEIGSRPPVGRFAPPLNRNKPSQPNSNSRKPNGSSSSAKGDNRPRQRNNNRDKNNGFTNGRRDSQKRGGRNDYKNKNRHNKKVDTELEAAAINDCNEAMAHLNSNPSEEQYVLKPRNSFYRRLQHQHVVSQGFLSESTGEGNERAVAVLRKD